MWWVLVGPAGLGQGRPTALQPASLALDSMELQPTNPPRDARAPRERRERPHYSCRCFPAYVKARATWDRQQGGQAIPDEENSEAAAQAVDAMFKSAAPPFADGIEGSGVCAHMLDPDDDHTADAPWLGCNEADVTSECPEETVMHTRSCTEINALWNYLWPGGVSMLGWLIAPGTQHECAWVHDAQSVNGDPCPGGDVYNQTSASIGTTLSWQLQIGRPMHNEVIISGDTFVQQLPSAIGAFVIVDCALYNQSWEPMEACLADDAPTRQELIDGARHMQASYQAAFPSAGAPVIVSYVGSGFELVPDGELRHEGDQEGTQAERDRWRAAYAKLMGRVRAAARQAGAELAERALSSSRPGREVR